MAVNLMRKRIRNIKKLMMLRCYSEKCKDYKYYGQKGIAVCNEWHDTKNFITWAISSGYHDGLTIDRIDPKKDYFPENCRWVTHSDNCRFKSTTRSIDVDGDIKSGRQWADYLGLGPNTINRIFNHYGEEVTKKFIVKRMENPQLEKRPKESWVEAYGVI